jgi:hypothetical protein
MDFSGWRSRMAGTGGSNVTAGPITFVVEHRAVVQDGVEAGGPTVRVLGGDDDHEYLRFDMFNVNPHYHYEPPATEERILMIDTVAEGDAVSWGLARLRYRADPGRRARRADAQPRHRRSRVIRARPAGDALDVILRFANCELTPRPELCCRRQTRGRSPDHQRLDLRAHRRT